VCVALGCTGVVAAQETAQPPKPAEQASTAQKTPAAKKTAAAQDADSPESSDGAFSIGLFYWLNPATMQIRNGHAHTDTNPADLDFPKKNQPTPGAVLSIPAGGQNTLRVTYFRTRASGNFTATKALSFYGTDYAIGDYMAAGYTLQSGKVSYDFLTWPNPSKGSTLRIKTLWEVQMTGVKANFDAPIKVDENGDAVAAFASGTRWFAYPMLGLGIEKFFGKNARFETHGSGFWLPHRSNVYDADALLAFRKGIFELGIGGKVFHFRTSPKLEDFFQTTLPGAFVMIRWYPK
jgi:hypothetical protein